MDKPHEELDQWNTAMELAVMIFRVTNSFPKEGGMVSLTKSEGLLLVFPAILTKELVGGLERNAATSCIWPRDHSVN